MEARGAGELLVNSIDRDGTKAGYDVPLLRIVKNTVSLPIIASSGAGKKEDFAEAFVEAGVEAALAARIFHDGTLPVQELKKYLAENYIPVRQ